MAYRCYDMLKAEFCARFCAQREVELSEYPVSGEQIVSYPNNYNTQELIQVKLLRNSSHNVDLKTMIIMVIIIILSILQLMHEQARTQS